MADFKKYMIDVGVALNKQDRAKLKTEVRNAMDDVRNEAKKLDKGLSIDDSGLRDALEVLRGIFDELNQHKTNKGTALTDLATEGKGLYKDFIAMQSSVSKLEGQVEGLNKSIEKLNISFKPFMDMLQTKQPVFFASMQKGIDNTTASITKMAKAIAGVDSGTKLQRTIKDLEEVLTNVSNTKYTIDIDYDVDDDILSKKLKKIIGDADNWSLEELLKEQFGGLSSNYDILQDKLDGMKEGTVEYVKESAKAIPILKEMLAINQRFSKLKPGESLLNADDIFTNNSQISTEIKQLFNDLHTEINKAKQKLSKATNDLLSGISTVNVTLNLSNKDKQEFINEINKYIKDINDKKFGDLQKVDVALNLNNDEKKPKTPKGKATEVRKNKEVIDSVNKNIAESEAKIKTLQEQLPKLQEDSEANPKNTRLKGKINAITREIEATTKAVNSQKELLNSMENSDTSSMTASGWKRFEAWSKNIAAAQDRILSDTLKWRREMSDALTLRYTWKGDKAENEISELFDKIQAKAYEKPIDLEPDTQSFIEKIEDALNGHIFNIKINSDSPIAVKGVFAEGSPFVIKGNKNTVSNNKPYQAASNDKPVDQISNIDNQTLDSINAETDVIIKFAEEQVRKHNDLQNELNVELKKLQIGKKDLRNKIDEYAANENIWKNLKGMSVSEIRNQTNIGNEKDKKFLEERFKSYDVGNLTEAKFKEEISKRYDEKHNYLQTLTDLFNRDKEENQLIVKKSEEILKIRDNIKLTTDSAEIDRLSSQINQTLISAITEAFKQFIQSSDLTIKRSSEKIVSLQRQKKNVIDKYNSQPEVQAQIKEAEDLQSQINELESKKDVNDYENLLKRIFNLQSSKTKINQDELDNLIQQRDNVDNSVKQEQERLVSLRRQLNEKMQQNKTIAEIVDIDKQIAKSEKARSNAQRRQAAYGGILIPLDDYSRNGTSFRGLRSLLGSDDTNEISNFIIKNILSKTNAVDLMGPKVKSAQNTDQITLFSTTAQQLITDTVRTVQDVLGYSRQTTNEANRETAVKELLKYVIDLTNKGKILQTVMNRSNLDESQFGKLRAAFIDDLKPNDAALNKYISLLEAIKNESKKKNPNKQTLDNLKTQESRTSSITKDKYDRYIRFQNFGKAIDEYEMASKELIKNIDINDEGFKQASDKVNYFTKRIIDAYNAIPDGSEIKNKIDVALGITKDSDITKIFTANYDSVKGKIIRAVGTENKTVEPLIMALKQLSKWNIYSNKEKAFQDSIKGVKANDLGFSDRDSINAEIFKLLKAFKFLVTWVDEEGKRSTIGYNTKGTTATDIGTKINPGYNKAAEIFQLIVDNWDRIEDIQILSTPNTATFGLGAGKVIVGGERPSEISSMPRPKAEQEYSFATREIAALGKRKLIQNTDFTVEAEKDLNAVNDKLLKTEQNIAELDVSIEELQKSADIAKSRLDELGTKSNISKDQVISEVIQMVEKYESTGKTDEVLLSKIEDLLQLPYDGSGISQENLKKFENIQSVYSINGRQKSLDAESFELSQRYATIQKELVSTTDEKKKNLKEELSQIEKRLNEISSTKINTIRQSRERDYDNILYDLNKKKNEKTNALAEKQRLTHEQDNVLSEEQITLRDRILEKEKQLATATGETKSLLEAEVSSLKDKYAVLETAAQRLEREKTTPTIPTYSPEDLAKADQDYRFEVIDAATDDIKIADEKIDKLNQQLDAQQERLRDLKKKKSKAKFDAYNSYRESAIDAYIQENPDAYNNIYKAQLEDIQKERGKATDEREDRTQQNIARANARKNIQANIEDANTYTINGVSYSEIIKQAIESQKLAIQETRDRIEKEKIYKEEMQNKIASAKQEGQITEEMIAARKGLVAETKSQTEHIQQSNIVYDIPYEEVDSSRGTSQISGTTNGVQYIDYANAGYGTMYNVNLDHIEGTLDNIYTLLSGQAPQKNGLSDAERKAIKDEIAVIDQKLMENSTNANISSPKLNSPITSKDFESSNKNKFANDNTIEVPTAVDIKLKTKPSVDTKSIDDIVDTLVKNIYYYGNESFDQQKKTIAAMGYNYGGSYIDYGHRRDDFTSIKTNLNTLDSKVNGIVGIVKNSLLKGDMSSINGASDVLDVIEKKLMELDTFFDQTKGAKGVKDMTLGRKYALELKDNALSKIAFTRQLLGYVSDSASQQYLSTELNKYAPKNALTISEENMKSLMRYDMSDIQNADWGFNKKKIDWDNVRNILNDISSNFTEIESGALYGAKIGDVDVIRRAMEYLNLVGKAITSLDTELSKQDMTKEAIFRTKNDRDKVVEQGKYLRERLSGFLPTQSTTEANKQVSAEQQKTAEVEKQKEAVMNIGKALSIIDKAIGERRKVNGKFKGGSDAKTESGMAKAYENKIHNNPDAVEAARFLYNTPNSELTSKFGKDTKQRLIDFRNAWLNKNENKLEVTVQPTIEPGATSEAIKKDIQTNPATPAIQRAIFENGQFIDGTEEELEKTLPLMIQEFGAPIKIEPVVDTGYVKAAIDNSMQDEKLDVPIEPTINIESFITRRNELQKKLDSDINTSSNSKLDGSYNGGLGNLAKENTLQQIRDTVKEIADKTVKYQDVKVDNKYTQEETQEAARSGVLEESEKELAEMVQDSIGSSIKTTFQRVGLELEKSITRTDTNGNQTWTSQISNKVGKAMAKTKEEMFRSLKVGENGTSEQFGIGTTASNTLNDYINLYNKLIGLVQEFNKKGSNKPVLQAQIENLLPSFKEAEKELNKLIIRKEKFMGEGEYLGTLNASDIKKESLIDIAKKQFFTNGLTPGQNIATAGVRGNQLLVDLLDNGTITRYALEVDEATGQVRKLLVAEGDLANAFQNVNKAMRQNESVQSSIAGLDITTEGQLQEFLNNAYSPELDAYNTALKEMQQYTADLWNVMKDGGSASEQELNYLMMLSERVISLGNNLQKTSIKFKEFWAQNPDRVTALNINTRNNDGTVIQNRDKIVANQMEVLAREQARANNSKYDFVSFDNDQLTYKLTDVEGNIQKVIMVWDELYQKVITVNDKSVASLDPVITKIKQYEEVINNAITSGYLNKNDSDLAKFNDIQKKIQEIAQDVKNGTTTYEKQEAELGRLRQKAAEYGNTVKNTVKKNERLYKGTNEVNSAKRQFDKLQGTYGFDKTESNPQILQKYTIAYDDLIRKYNEYVELGQMYDPQKQEELRQQAAKVQALGRAYNNVASEIETLEANYKRSQDIQITDKTGNSVSLGGKTEISDTKNLKEQMEAYAATLGHVNIENVKFDNIKQQMTYSIRMNNKEVADMVIKYNSAAEALYAYNKGQRESLSGIRLLWAETQKKFKQILQYTASMTSLYRLWSILKQGVQYIKEIDSALTELRKVTDETEETYDKFLNTAAKTAGKVGSTIKEVVSSTADFARLGYSLADAAKMAENAQLLMNVSEFTDISSATDTLISAVQAFSYTADETLHVVDILNKIGEKNCRNYIVIYS